MVRFKKFSFDIPDDFPGQLKVGNKIHHICGRCGGVIDPLEK
jgi:hypothetical protein